MRFIVIFLFLVNPFVTQAQNSDEIYSIIDTISSNRIQKDIETLVGFGTRHTFSDTISKTRGIGAATKWIKNEFEKISEDCQGCLEVLLQKNKVTKDMGNRIPFDSWITNVVAIQKGTLNPNNYIIMTGDIDSRVSDVMDFSSDAPGANDNATGIAGILEAARILSQYKFENTIVFAGLAGEEQGLFGGKGLAEYAKEKNWNILGVLNNDMIGNIEGVDGVIDNRSFRIFSEPTPPTETERDRTLRRYYGGEVDGISRQLARYVHKITETFMPEMNPMLIYRLDRFGRGGHHKPFNDLGYAGIRIMEAHENYNHQHQDIRKDDGIQYGDLIEFVNIEYVRKLTTVNAITSASLAHAPIPPSKLSIGGAVSSSTKLKWDKIPNASGYVVYWRDTTSPTWDHRRYVGDINEFTLHGIVIDNYNFGVSSISKEGFESIVSYPSEILRD